MTYADLTEKASDIANVTKKGARAVLDTFVATVLECGEEGITIPKLGSFKYKSRAQRQGRNPRTGERVTIPPRTRLVFRPAASLQRKASKAVGEPTPAES